MKKTALKKRLLFVSINVLAIACIKFNIFMTKTFKIDAYTYLFFTQKENVEVNF